MVKEFCPTCCHYYHWHWEEAFDKFGFQDGDGSVETGQVESCLIEAGYDVVEDRYGLHNFIITSIKKDSVELIPASAIVGYDNPRHYLPAEIVELLDKELPSDTPYKM